VVPVIAAGGIIGRELKLNYIGFGFVLKLNLCND
jgi:hypothetical protein